MFKRILLPVDPARPFAAAHQYAVDLAHKYNSSITAAYIIDEHLVAPVAEEAAQSLDEALEWVGNAAIDEFCNAHEDLEVTKSLAYGNTATALFQLVLQTGADTVVLGGYHSRHSPHVWGSTVADIVHHAERPVFVVREHGRIPGEGDRIVVPFDGSERPLANLPRIIKFAKEHGAALDLVYVAKNRAVPKAEAALERGAWVCKEDDVACETHIIQASRFRTKGRSILDYARRVGSPLIAISRLGEVSTHTGRSRTVTWLLAHSPVPVWVVRK